MRGGRRRGTGTSADQAPAVPAALPFPVTRAPRPDDARYASLRAAWTAAWPEALGAWGRFTRLRPPRLHGAGEVSGATSFAWFSLGDVEVSIDLEQVLAEGIEDHAVAVLAHEIGHHVYSPADMLTAGRMTAQVRLGLVDLDHRAGLVTNLWSDMLINDRLQTRAGIDMVGLWRRLGPPQGEVMTLLLRTDEILWSLPAGTLSGPGPHADAEAQVLARLVRTYADDPAAGAGGFAMVLRPFLARDTGSGGGQTVVDLPCAQHEHPGTPVPGLATAADALRPPVHPALDPRVVGTLAATEDSTSPTPGPQTGLQRDPVASQSAGSTLTPADYAAVLQSLGVATSPESAAIAWYREHAARHLVPFPTTATPAAPETLLGGLDPWETGDDLADVDWTATMLASPVVVPGMTTVQRHLDSTTSTETDDQPVDLDLYLDSSGSMPDPRHQPAPIALAGAVLALSALRSGARVQATTWSGPGQIAGTDGFTRDVTAVMSAVVAYFGGSTSFPIPLLEQTHLDEADRSGSTGSTASAGSKASNGSAASAGSPARSRRRRRHIAVISDSGVVSMFADGAWSLPEDFEPLTTSAARAVRAAGGGGSLVLNVAGPPDRYVDMAPGYAVYTVSAWEDVVPFARDLARTLWGQNA
ncbi:hypothetical protein [Sanguibacter sp. Leaf3]|uniref:hypothetical protein n=1 Tax=Sanguibacter sp. Leaf3 TaxID=1736209 RepID=UPI0006FE4E33|nr:hypothetical protein [Sanguibacter sp. Leaf3]KQT99708.1 hypothetical protein ASG53_02380 [Sanguibacter sp. Leaf3]